MPRVALTVQSLLGPHPGTIAADAMDITFTAGDATDFNDFPHTGREIIIARNDNIGAQTITFTSIAAGLRRTGHVTAYSIGAGEHIAFYAGDIQGWKQTDGKFYIDVSHVDVKLAILRHS